MSPAFKIAWRYFRGKKSAQAINIISWISIGAIAVSSAAMIVLFSVFNGLEGTVRDMYATFYPEMKVSPVKGKFFHVTEVQQKALAAIPGIDATSFCLQDLVLLNSSEEQKIATLKGVDEAWFRVSDLDSFMESGKASWAGNRGYTPVITGLGIAMALGVDLNNDFSSLTVYYPRKDAGISDDPATAMNAITVKPRGSFRIQEEFDGQYVLIPLDAARYLFGTAPGELSAVEIKLRNRSAEAGVRSQLEAIFGNQVKIENRFEQNRTFFTIMRSEKWAVYAILLMVLLIASFNMIGSLSMVVLEKKKDIAILKSMGARKRTIRAVFLIEGALLAFLGGGIGIITGLLLCLGQQHFGWISLPEGFIISAYPVSLQVADFALVMTTACLVGLLAAWYPAVKASRQPVYVREE